MVVLRTMCIIWIVSILIFSSGNCFAQFIHNTDSLESVLKETKSDLKQLEILHLLIESTTSSDPQKALEYSRQFFKLAQELGNNNKARLAHTEMARIYIDLSLYDSAYKILTYLIPECEKTGDFELLGRNYNNKGYLSYCTGTPDSAFNYFSKSFKIYRNNAQNEKGQADALNGMASMLMVQAKYDSAIYYFLKLFKISEKNNFESILGKGYINIATCFRNMNETEKSKEYYLKSIAVNQKLNNTINLSKAYLGLGNIFCDVKDYEQAENYYQQAVNLYKQSNYIAGLADAYIGLGDIADNKGDLENAYDYFELSKSYYLQLQNQEGFLISSKNQGSILTKWKHYKKALKIFDTCLLIARELNLSKRVLEIYHAYRNTYIAMGDFEKAFNELQRYNDLRDTILAIEKQLYVEELETRYNNEKLLAANLKLENEKLEKDVALEKRTRQRNGYLFGGSGAIVLFIFSISFIQQRNRKNRIISEQRIIQLKEEKKLLAARSIVEGQEEERKRIAKELHDGLGVLLSSAKMHFSSLEVKNERNQTVISTATKLLEQATTDVRRISHNMMPGLLTRFGLFEAVEDLLEQVDEMEGIQVDYQFHGEEVRMVENTEIMLYRIIQEMINNTLKYAQAENIKLEINLVDHALHIIYKDDGKGFNLDEKLGTKSMGLTSIQSRVKYLEGSILIDTAPGRGVEYSIDIRHVDFVDSPEAVGV
ncbi:MAG: tetratricopeptide repeat protein [Bacteroidetes bacterium]|nr:tetratricopeptide repeat protein [Bacteroidota bacterium]